MEKGNVLLTSINKSAALAYQFGMPMHASSCCKNIAYSNSTAIGALFETSLEDDDSRRREKTIDSLSVKCPLIF